MAHYVTLTTADVATVGKNDVGIIYGLTAALEGACVCGPAFTARGRSGDNLVLHRALAEASRGDVIVVELDGDVTAGHWGALMTQAAQRAGIVGLVIDGTIRDLHQIRNLKFPVFYRGTAPNPASKTFNGALREPVRLGSVTVNQADLIVLDPDGMVVVPRTRVDDVLAGVHQLHEAEEKLIRRIGQGETTIDALGLEVT